MNPFFDQQKLVLNPLGGPADYPVYQLRSAVVEPLQESIYSRKVRRRFVMIFSLVVVISIGLIHTLFSVVKEPLQPVLHFLRPNQSFRLALIALKNSHHFTVGHTTGVLGKSHGFLIAFRSFNCNFITIHLNHNPTYRRRGLYRLNQYPDGFPLASISLLTQHYNPSALSKSSFTRTAGGPDEIAVHPSICRNQQRIWSRQANKLLPSSSGLEGHQNRVDDCRRCVGARNAIR